MYYMSQSFKVACFVYNNKVYQAGTKIIYNGPYIINNNKYTNKIIASFMYYDGKYAYCNNGEVVYKIESTDFEKNIVQIMYDENKSPPVTKEEFYWTDDMVTNTIWYIIVMAVGTIFYDRVGIWILATVIWYFSTFKKK